MQKLTIVLFFMGMVSLFSSCDNELPDPENESEVITDVTLTFTNTADASDVVTATAQDPDGDGVQSLQILDSIRLDTNKTYTLSIDILNKLDTANVESITEEVEEEGDEHQLFFAFTNDAFTNPAGDGNIDTASDAINYNDVDSNGNNLGLSTTWTTGSTTLTNGTFQVQLQHQPDLKTATTGADVGDTDVNLTFVLVIE